MQQSLLLASGYTTQKDIIRWHLMEKGSITNVQARDLYGITRVEKAIEILRKEFAKNGFLYRIESDWQKGVNRFGRPCRWVKYRLCKTTQEY